MHSGDTIRGRVQFAAIIAIGAAGFLLLGLVDWQQGADINWLAAVGRPVMFVGFGALAWQGRLWARTLVALWLALIGAVLVGRSVAVMFPGDAVAAMWMGIGLLFLGSAVLLYRSPHIRSALAERQRLARAATAAPPAA